MPHSELFPSSSGDKHLEEQCRLFVGALAAGAAPPRLEDYLQGRGAARQDALFEKLLALELHGRIECGELPSVADYHERFPEQRELVEQLLGQASRASREGEPEATILNVPGEPAASAAGYEFTRQLTQPVR